MKRRAGMLLWGAVAVLVGSVLKIERAQMKLDKAFESRIAKLESLPHVQADVDTAYECSYRHWISHRGGPSSEHRHEEIVDTQSECLKRTKDIRDVVAFRPIYVERYSLPEMKKTGEITE